MKYALITGGNSDIAQNIAYTLIKSDFKVVVTSKNRQKLKENYKNLNNIIYYPADLAKKTEVNKLIDFAKLKFSKIDLIIHCAGIYHYKGKPYNNINFEDFSNSEVVDNIMVTVIAPMLLIKNLSHLFKTNTNIINISGTFETAKGWLPYYVSKKALEDFTVGLSEEFKDKNIRVNCISPGDTLTETYKKYFPQYATSNLCIKPKEISKLVMKILKDSNINGKIIEIAKYTK